MANTVLEFGKWGDAMLARYAVGQTDAIVRALEDGSVAGVSFAPWYGFNSTQLESLQRFNKAKVLVVQDLPDFPLPLLKDFDRIEELSIGASNFELDAKQFPKLRRVSCDWHKKMFKNADGAMWESLRLWKYSNSSGDLTDLPTLPELRRLELTQSPIKTLLGIERYTSVEEVGLFYLSKLTSLVGIERIPLRIFGAEHCKKLSEYDALGACSELSELKIHHCASIQSLSFVKSLPKLTSFRFMNTDVTDGDLLPLKGIRDLMFTQKKHFSHTPEQLKDD